MPLNPFLPEYPSFGAFCDFMSTLISSDVVADKKKQRQKIAKKESDKREMINNLLFLGILKALTDTKDMSQSLSYLYK